MEIFTMKGKLVLFGAAFAATFWACGDGSIVSKDGADDMALLNYGEFNPDGMKNLKDDAIARCMAEEECAKSMDENNEVIPLPESSESGDTPTSSTATTTSSTATASSASTGSSASQTTSSAATTSSASTGTSSASQSSASTSSASNQSSASADKASVMCYAEPSSAKVGDNVTWTANSMNNNVAITSYSWTFADGTTSTEQSPKKTYSATGSYSATLVVNKGTATESIQATCVGVTVSAVESSASTQPSSTSQSSASSGGDVDVWKQGAELTAGTHNLKGCNDASGTGPKTVQTDGSDVKTE